MRAIIARWLCAQFVFAPLCISPALAQVRIVNYNVAQLNGNQPALEAVFEALNADDKPGWAVAPHLYVFQEVQSTDTAPLLTRLNSAAPPGVTYALGTYTNNNENSVAGAQAMYYRTDTFTEDVAAHVDIPTGGSRNTDRWRLRLIGYDSDAATLYIYSSHLKASTGSSNEQERLAGATAIRNNANALPAGTHIIYAGDYNVYSNGEPAYQKMIEAGVAQATDPLGTGSWGGAGNAWKHTQSPQDGGPLVGGGMDDRFDLQLSTAAFHDGEGLSLIAGTYRPFGNDGSHYNLAINNGNNTYYPADIPRSNALADYLFDASDHVPVVAEYQRPAVLMATGPADLGRVIQGSPVTWTASVANAAIVVAASGVGADELDFTVTGSGSLSGSDGGVALATIPASDVDVALAVSTAVVGPIAGVAAFTTTSQGAQVSTPAIAVTGAVVRASNASLSETSDLAERVISRVASEDGGAIMIPVNVWNRGYDGDQALLDLDAIDPLDAPLTYVGGLATGVGAAAATVSLEFDPTGLGNADFVDAFDLHVSDEDLPGESAGALSVTVRVYVRVLIGDVDGDCSIGLADLSALLTTFGACEGDPGFDAAADLDNSGCVDLADLSELLTGFGSACP